MPDDTTKLIISLELILRNLQQTLKGLSQVEAQLKRVSTIKIGTTTAANFDKATLNAQKLSVQAQELANRQTKAAQTADQLALSQLKLEQAFARAAAAEQKASEKVAAGTKAEAARARADVARINAETVRQANEQQDLRIKAAKTLADVQIREAQRGADAFVAGLENERQATEQFKKNIGTLGNALRSAGQGFSTLGIALSTALTVPLVALGKTSLDAAVTLDSLKRGLETIAGSSVEASVQLQRLTQIAKLPGIGFEEAIQGSIRLQAVGFSARDAEKALREFSNAIALTGGGRAELERVTVQLGQLAAKGKVLSQDLRPIIEAAPAVGTALKKAFGTVNADDIAKLTDGSEDFLKTLVAGLGELPRAAGGAKNSFENFKDEIFLAAAAVGDALIPVITKLAETIVPVVTALARGFKQLPEPLQAIVVVVGAFGAALGPVLFIFGQLVTASGRLLVSYAQLNVAGIGPTIANLRALIAAGGVASATELTLAESTTVAAAAFVALNSGIVLSQQELAAMSAACLTGAEAEAALGAGAVLATGGLAAIGILLGGLITALALYSAAEEKAVAVDEDAAQARLKNLDALNGEVKFLEGLKDAVGNTAEEQKRLIDIYAQLDDVGRARVKLVSDESSSIEDQRRKLAELIKVKKENIQQDLFSAQATSLQLVNNLTIALQKQAEAQEKFNKAKAESLRTTTTGEFGEEIQGLQTVETLLKNQRNQALLAADALKEIGETRTGTDAAAASIKNIAQAAGISTDKLLEQARAAGATAEQIKQAKKAIDDLADSENSLVPQMDEGTKAILKQLDALKKLKDEPAVVIAEESKTALDSVLKLIREQTSSLADAKAALQNYIFLVPQLGEAVKRLGGIDTVIKDLFTPRGQGRDKGTQLRNAQQQLADALLQVAKANAEQELKVLDSKNELELQRNETAFKLQLISYREYLQARAALTASSLNLEIEQQALAVKTAKDSQQRLIKAAAQAGIPDAERIRREAEAAKADEKSIQAQTRLKVLEQQRTLITEGLSFALAENAKEQEDSVRRLEIEFAKLQGRIADALKQESAEEFRKVLENLAKTQERLTHELAEADRQQDAAARKKILAAQAANKEEIDLIRNSVREKDALADLAAAEQFIANSKEKQSDLEKQIANDVDFRGLRETEAIRRRLAGEDELKQRLLIARGILIDTIEQLGGLKPPKQLLDAIKEIDQQVERLGKLSFTEQFDLAAKEFTRIQDELQAKIAEVELAVRHRDLAEVEGRILIKKLNGEYVADLERQAELLRQIAEKSGQQGLQKQAVDAQATAREVRAATTETAEFSKALRSVSIDALQEGFADFFRDLTDRTKTAQEKLLGLLDSVAARITDFAAQKLSEQLIESLFGTPQQQQAGAGGLFNAIKRIFGFGGGGAEGGAGGGIASVAGQVTTEAAAHTGEAAAAAALTTGATTAGTAMAAGGTAAGTSMTAGGVAFTASITTAAAAFATAVVGAGAAFAAAVAAGSAAQAIGGAGSSIGSALGAATGMFPATPGGLVRIVEGGFDEAVLTTDPQHAAKQVRVLQQFLARTKGLYGRIQGFAEGGVISAKDAEMNLLASLSPRASVIPAHAPAPQLAAAEQGGTSFRILNLLDKKQLVGGHLRSAEGARDIMNVISEHADEIGRRIRVQ